MEKFIHFHLFTFIFFSILLLVVLGNANSLSSLNSTYIREARQRFMSVDPSKLPDPPMPPYTFTVYHRDVFEKSKFKDYDSLLENRLARSRARASYLSSILGSKNTREGGIRRRNPTGTYTYYGSGEYVASFLLGSRRIRNFLIMDTGSDLIWWQCGPCSKCYKQDQQLYNSSASETFRIPSCKDYKSTCNTDDPDFYCDPINSKCTYTAEYADFHETKGFIAEDVITFGFDYWPVDVMFGCSNDQSGGKRFRSFAGGLVGLGRALPRGYSLLSQFEVHLISMCLPTFSSAKGSVLNFGTSKWPRATSAKLLYNSAKPSLYYVNIYKIFINNREIPVRPAWWNIQRDKSGGMFVDTGTTISTFPHDLYIVFREVFKQEARLTSMVEHPWGVEPFDTCYMENPNGGDLSFPVVRFYFGSVSPSTMLLLTKERVMVKVRDLYCLGFVGWNERESILGMNQLQGVALTFDTEADTLSFDIDACD